MIDLIQKFNNFVFKLSAKKTGIVIAAVIIGAALIVAGISIHTFLVRREIIQTHNALKAYVDSVKKLDETVRDLEKVENSLTLKSSIHRYKDDIIEYNKEYVLLQKAHQELQKHEKAPSKNTESYYKTVREFDEQTYTEYTETKAMLASTQKMMKVMAVMQEQKIDRMSFTDINSEQDLIEHFEAMKGKFQALRAALPVIKNDVYFDVFYQPLDKACELAITDFDKLVTAIKNRDIAALEELERSAKDDFPDMDDIDTYKIEKAMEKSKKRTDAINAISPKLNEKDKAILQAYNIVTEDQLPSFFKLQPLNDSNTFKKKDLLDLPVNRL